MSLPPPTAIRSALDEILPGVQKPSRYLGLERNLTRKSWESVTLRVALAFPDAYEIGMSHQGTRILYHLINRREDALAERAFAPMPDMAEAMRGAGLPLYTLESYRAVAEFDVVGISLQSELNYINIPYLLDLAGIERRAADRGQNSPIILGGGPCTANPEPVADFFDAILIGDGEAALDEILDAVRDGRAAEEDRNQILRHLAKIPGVYVPTFYRWHEPLDTHPARWEKEDADAPFPVARVWVDRLDPEDQPDSVIVPFADVIQDRLGLEIMRGCTQGCRFCQAGYWYRPVREHDPDAVLQRIERQVAETGFEEVGLLSLSTADYSQVEPLVSHLADTLQDRRVSISLPSLRADAFSVGLAEAVSKVRKSGFTFAPETGSDRLRRLINKTFTNEDMLRAAEAAFAKGWNLIKVYAMIGLPTETDDDLEELARLTEEIVRTGRRVSGGRRVEVKVSVGCFVPKAWTPFQWQPFAGVGELRRRIQLIKQRFRRIRGARLTWSDPDEAALESILSRGGRNLSGAVERAHDLGAIFDGWSDHLDLDAWRRALMDCGVDVERELAARELTDVLPWDFIDAGVRKNFLKAEWRRAQRETQTVDCNWGHCYRCGIPGDGDDTQLASGTLPVLGESHPADEGTRSAAYVERSQPRMTGAAAEKVQPPVHRRYRFTFSKTGDARLLSHRQLMDTLERVVRATGIPVRYTEGFNPHIRLSMGPALAVGHQGEAEIFDVDCTAPVRENHIQHANELLPDGVEIRDVKALLPGAPSLGKLVSATRYRVNPGSDQSRWPESPDELTEELRAGVVEWQTGKDGCLEVELNVRQEDGPTLSLKQLLTGLGIDENRVARLRVTRKMLVLRPRQKNRHQESSKISGEAAV
jgi:radical SAM family uncharacterized protein/radical SAM-linked protein